MGEIISPFATTVVPGEVQKDVISALEDLLAKAKAGEVTGVGFFFTDPGNAVTTYWVSGKASENLMVVGATRLQFRIMLSASDG